SLLGLRAFTSRNGSLGVSGDRGLPQRPEPRANVLCIKRGLLPRRKVPALVLLLEVDKVGIGALGPAPRGLKHLVRKGAERDRDGDVFRGKEGGLVLPID